MKSRLALLALLSMFSIGATSADKPLDLSSLPKIGEVDPRYQSYNVEMVEITGGRFWAPYGGPADEMYRMRPPVNLANPRLLALAKQLGPTYMRVSGTWANSTYLLAEGETVKEPPAGFQQVLTRDQWRGVIAFSKAVDAKLVTSFAASDGTRAADGAWKADQAQRVIDLTRETGGSIYAAEFVNEPNIPTHGALPKGYDAAAYVRDFKIYRAWAAKAAPGMKIKGHGGVAEGSMMKSRPETISRGFLNTEDFMKLSPNSVDIVAYHYYGGVSMRCKGSPESAKENALKPEWLDRTLIDHAHYAALRDRYEPGKPLWLNETAQAACGGSPWASTFLDSFRYLNQLGVLAQKGVQVVMHNTLAASDYALIDGDTLKPRPNYWAAVLWNRTMGSTVLAPPKSPSPDLRLYAHCLKGKKGGVGVLAMNISGADQSLYLGNFKAITWQMTGDLDTRDVLVNGLAPSATDQGNILNLDGKRAKGKIVIPKQSIAFLAITNVRNKACL